MARRVKSFFISILLAVIMLFGGIMTFGNLSEKKANALSPDYHGTNNSIYYYCDLYPILDEDELTSFLPSWVNCYGIFYDIQPYMTEYQFATQVNNGYFEGADVGGFGSNCLAIIELKTLSPTETVLNEIFTDLKDQNCKILFVSSVAQSSYSTSLMSKVDSYVQCGRNKFQNYVSYAVADMISKDGLENGSTDIYIDKQFMGNEFASDGQQNWVDLYNNSPYFRYLMQEFNLRFFSNLTTDLVDIDNIKQYLSAQENMLYVHIGGGAFTNIVSGSGGQGTYKFGMGKWQLPSDLYQIWETEQDEEYFPIYVWEEDPIEITSNGLFVISDAQLRDDYGYYDDQSMQMQDIEKIKAALNQLITIFG